MLGVRLFQPLQNPDSILEELRTTDSVEFEAFKETAGAKIPKL